MVFLGIKAYEYTAKFQHGIMPGYIGDNLIDPELLLVANDPNYPQWDEKDADGSAKYKWYIREAGPHPYDANGALVYKNKVKAILVTAAQPVFDKIKAKEEEADKAKKTLTDADKKAIVDEILNGARGAIAGNPTPKGHL